MYKQTPKLPSFTKRLQMKPITIIILIMLVYPMSCSKKKLEPAPKIEKHETKQVQQGVFEVTTHSVQRTTKKADSTSIATRTDSEITTCIIDGMIVDDLSNPLCQCDRYDLCSDPGDIGNIPNLPDLIPSSITVSPSSILAGETLSFTIVVRNQGGIDFDENGFSTIEGLSGEGVLVNIHVLREGDNNVNTSNLAFRGIFDPRVFDENDNTYLLSNSFTLLPEMVTPGFRHRLVVVVNPGCLMAETSCSNNSAADNNFFAVASEVDLVPLNIRGDFTLSPTTVKRGGKLDVGCKVKNLGPGVLRGPNSFKIKYTATRVGSPDPLGTTIGTSTVTLNSGQTVNAGIIFNTNGLLPASVSSEINLAVGDYTIKAIVDSDNDIDEVLSGAETNNIVTLGTITVTPKVDLVLLPVGGTPISEILRCNRNVIPMIIQNRGDERFQGTVVIDIQLKEFLPPNGIYDIHKKSFNIDINPGASTIVNLLTNSTHPLPGLYESVANLNTSVSESNNENNTFKWDIAIKESGSCGIYTDMSLFLSSSSTTSLIPFVRAVDIQVTLFGADTYPCQIAFDKIEYIDDTGTLRIIPYHVKVDIPRMSESSSIPFTLFNKTILVAIPFDAKPGTVCIFHATLDPTDINREDDESDNKRFISFRF
jgi:hypothetical protein